MTLCLIPCRSGSKRLPGKNWLEVGGKTLVQRAVDCALGAGLKPYIVTDAPERCALLGAVVLRMPDELASDDVPMRDVVAWWREAIGYHGQVVLLQPTSPLRTWQDVDGCLLGWPFSGNDVVSVTAKPGHTYERNGAVYIMRGNEIQGWTQLYVMPPERSVDIDTAEDLEEARRLAGG